MRIVESRLSCRNPTLVSPGTARVVVLISDGRQAVRGGDIIVLLRMKKESPRRAYTGRRAGASDWTDFMVELISNPPAHSGRPARFRLLAAAVGRRPGIRSRRSPVP